MILKNVLGVHSKSSNMAVRCELGIFPLYVKCYTQMFNYFLRLNDIEGQMDGPYCILKAAFEIDKTFSSKENSWSNSLKELIKKTKIDSLNISKQLFKSKLQDYFKSKVKTEMMKIKEEGSGKLKFYSRVFTKFEQKQYLQFSIPKELRNNLTKIRISAHSLAIETGRYSKPKTPQNERLCKFCINKVEDEYHFLFICPQYNQLRTKYKIPNSITEESLQELLDPQSFKKLRTLCLFIKEAFEYRDHPTV